MKKLKEIKEKIVVNAKRIKSKARETKDEAIAYYSKLTKLQRVVLLTIVVGILTGSTGLLFSNIIIYYLGFLLVLIGFIILTIKIIQVAILYTKMCIEKRRTK